MEVKIKKLGQISSIIAFVLCLAGGIWILANIGFNFENDATSTAIGLYFIGKAFFVGPMLYMTAMKFKEG